MFGELQPVDGQPVVLKNGEYIYYPNFINVPTANNYLEAFKNNIEWKQESMNMYGKQVMFPRLTAWYGDNDKPYSFSGIKLNPTVWSKELIEIKNLIEPACNVEFNSVLLNLYRDGNDSISWHTDAEKELGKNPLIASVNFGAERKFQIRHNETHETHNIILKHGSLLIMKGELQHYWKHQVPKQKAVLKERINLTFRVIK
jgi:alkylated DNA repair dioxygenase AlkB